VLLLDLCNPQLPAPARRRNDLLTLRAMWYFLDPDFSQKPLLILVFLASVSAVIYIRYAAVSVLYKAAVSFITTTKRNSFQQKRAQIMRELKWASLSSVVFGMLCTVSVVLYNDGWTAIYTDIHDHSIAYLVLSPLLVLASYETYYYWLHRFMHTPPVYRLVHKVHHTSIEPTVFSAFSFHPLEALLQFLFFPVIIVILPLHLYALSAVFTVLTLSAMINHAGVELYGSGWVIRHIIGSSHHDLHHKEFKTNFGLTLTWWDKAMGTSSKNKKVLL
jgi:lathosterol oxidase